VKPKRLALKTTLTAALLAAGLWVLLFGGALPQAVLSALLHGHTAKSATLSKVAQAHGPGPPPKLTVNLYGSAGKVTWTDVDPPAPSVTYTRDLSGNDDFPVTREYKLDDEEEIVKVHLEAKDHDGWSFIRWEWYDTSGYLHTDYEHEIDLSFGSPITRTAVFMRAHVDIYDGGGGAMVSEDEEVSRGAFSAANTNDTDEDGIVDKDDPNVPGEVDLIKVVFRKPAPGAKVDQIRQEEDHGLADYAFISASGGPEVKLWKNSTKSAGEFTEIMVSVDDLPLTLWLEGRAVSSAPRDVSVHASWGVKLLDLASDTGKATFLSINLAAHDLFGVVAEDDEETEGAYVHYNIDNDNGNTDGGDPVADYTETGPVTGENDLKPATAALSPLVPTGGTVALKASSEGIKVWKSPSKGADNAVLTSGTEKTWDLSNQSQRDEFNAARSNLRVEGCTDGTVNLTLEYHIGSSGLSDMVKYTFIAATCGEHHPTPEQRNRIGPPAGWFPALVHCEWSITRPATGIPPTPGAYNCIAWSVDDTDWWYNKVSSDRLHGIVGIDEEYGDPPNGVFELADMDRFYLVKKGYTPTASDETDAQVMYYSGFHAAKKRGCACGAGKWIMYESKCGGAEAIEHVHDQLNGTTYGSPVRYYK